MGGPSTENVFYRRKSSLLFSLVCWGLVMLMPAAFILFGRDRETLCLMLFSALICFVCVRINGKFWSRPMLEVTPLLFRFHLLPPVFISDIEAAFVFRYPSFFKNDEFLFLQVREDRGNRFSFMQKLFLLYSAEHSDSFIIHIGLRQFREEDREKIKNIFMNGPWPSQILPPAG